MGLHVVAGHTENGGAGFHKIFVLVTELHGFRGATRGVVFGVKVQHHGFAIVGGVGHLDATGCVGFELGEGFIDNNRHRL